MKQKPIKINPPIIFSELAKQLGLEPVQLLIELLKSHHPFIAPNQAVEPSVAARICALHGYSLEGAAIPMNEEAGIGKNTYAHSELEKVRMELDSMIGLNDVKEKVHKIAALTYWRNDLKKTIAKPPEISNHMIFSGNPGTGKTTVARIIGKIFKFFKILTKGHFVEVDRQHLVGEYIGHTAKKTTEVLQSALGGVLFIDEAYSLTVTGSKNDFGKEAIATLLKFMEDNRSDIIVIAAGYEKDMSNFLKSNPGLESRFKTKITFPDYSNEECVEIFKRLSNEQNFVVENSQVYNRVCDIIGEIRKSRGKMFANGRDVRNLFENVTEQMAIRHYNKINVRSEDLYTIKIGDIDNIKI